MPELPEVEVLVRHLAPLLKNQTIRSVEVRRPRVIRPQTPADLQAVLPGATFACVSRRGKYLLFQLTKSKTPPRLMLGHLGMTGRMYLLPTKAPLPRHAAVVLGLGRRNFVFEDTRYFGRLTLDASAVESLGPEPLSAAFTPDLLLAGLRASQQPIKIKLLDQQLVAGLGNIYASEALHRAGISPRTPSSKLSAARVERLWSAIRQVLEEAIRFGSTVPLNFSGAQARDGLFYYGSGEAPSYEEERLQVYDRAGEPCRICGRSIQRLVQAGRSTFYCPRCQK